MGYIPNTISVRDGEEFRSSAYYSNVIKNILDHNRNIKTISFIDGSVTSKECEYLKDYSKYSFINISGNNIGLEGVLSLIQNKYLSELDITECCLNCSDEYIERKLREQYLERNESKMCDTESASYNIASLCDTSTSSCNKKSKTIFTSNLRTLILRSKTLGDKCLEFLLHIKSITNLILGWEFCNVLFDSKSVISINVPNSINTKKNNVLRKKIRNSVKRRFFT
jgi:hypothetical protein